MLAIKSSFIKRRTPTTIFLALSLVIFLSDALFVAINVAANNRTLERTLQSHSAELRSSFDLAVSLTYRNMMHLAMYIANDPEIQTLFLQGKRAVEAEGGGKGGKLAAKYRQTLYDHVAPSWSELTRNHDVRQLHFHLGPGSLSYLRVHSPGKYGDHMDDLRHIIVDTNRDLNPRSGFETGRVYSGLRAVVPVFATDPETGNSAHAGVLEVGTSFANIMHVISSGLEAEQVAVLLQREHVEHAMWPEAIKRTFASASRLEHYYVEALSEADRSALLQALPPLQTFSRLTTRRLKHQGTHYALTLFPLFDYQNSHPGGQPAGLILIASNINDEVNANTLNLQYNLLYALLGFVVIELLLYYAVQLITRKLQAVIHSKVRHIEELNVYLAEQAVTDGLTGLHNHRFFIERLGEEINKSRRSGRPLTLLMLDIDHFKQVNDNYGHQAGDRVLEMFAETIRHHVRAGDEAGRYGGEEFSIALTDSDEAQSQILAQRLLSAIRELAIVLADGTEIHITASLGIAQWDGEERIQLLIERADQALYQAKHHGRDRIELARHSG